MKKYLFLSLLCFLFIVKCLGQISSFSATDFTRKSVINFTQREYGEAFHSQNWSVVEDSRGIMHFGNNFRVLHYDGVYWDATPIPVYGGFVTSLAADDEGNIFVGANGEFGCLKPHYKGELKYISFSDSLDLIDSFFGIVWRTMLYDGGVLFFSQENIYHWKNDTIIVIEPETSFHLAFVVDDQLFVRQREIGFMKYEDQQLVLIPDGELFEDYGVFGIFPTDDKNQYLIVTQEIGLYMYNSTLGEVGIKPVNTPHKDILIESRIIGGTLLHNGKIALNTLNSGVIIINSKGIIEDIIDQNTGIRDNDVKQVYQDSWNNIWLALNTGISRVNYSSPVSFFKDNTGLHGSVQAIAEFNNNLYVGTNNGLYVENSNLKDKLYNDFIKFEGFNKGIKNLTTVNGQLVIGTREGLYTYNPRAGFRQIQNIDASSVYRSAERNLLFTAGENGFFIFRDQPYIRLLRSYTDLILPQPLNIAEVKETRKDGTELWIGTLNFGAFNVVIKQDLNIQYEHYIGRQAGLADTWIKPFQHKDKVYFGVYEGLMEFIDESELFIDDNMTEENLLELRGYFNFSTIQPLDSVAFNFFTYDYKKTWLCYDNQVAYIDNKNMLIKEPFLAINFPRINTILPVDSNIIWIGADDGLVRVDISWLRDYKTLPNINFFRITSTNDSLLSKGFYRQVEYKIPAIPYEYNDIAFYYASQFKDNEFTAQYSHKLSGYSDVWSDWLEDYRSIYTNLREGNYVFSVKARDIYGNESDVISYEFSILPPWYRTIWAYLIYGLLAVLIVIGIVQLSIMRLKAKNVQLEKIIEKRTEEIRNQKEKIEKQHAIVLKQKEEITSSITYASRIQNALVPGEDFLQDDLPENFILWIPRDIVSGDFYWAKKIEPYIFIVAADCTGHGVPGAFMSMLGIAFLNEIVQYEKVSQNSKDDDNIPQASTNLEEMRNYVKKTLHQTGERYEQKDGMDLAFCALNMQNNTLHYSGANCPLFIIRDGELIEYKATPNPIGIHIREKKFENHIIKLKEGDVIYTFSDGYRDQFGGNESRKFGKKAFSELLIEIHKKPSKEQKVILQQTITDWMVGGGGHSQLDDILVIGFKIENNS